ncbi:MAG: phosphoglycolate phosphatase [Thermoleophilaceae bacterium]|nr:phosphoglycolate phosphatase [Thermoleophilaceae bacterium]
MEGAPVGLLWDIDGTLITTARAGVFALEAAAGEVLGVEAALREIHTAGLTDAAIAEMIVEQFGGSPDPKQAEALLAAYERELPAALPRRAGQVMPGVLEILEDLRDEPGVVSLLLTGNTPAGARAKLTHYGLFDHISEGGMCTGPGTRTEIAERAKAMAIERLAGDPRLYVIGDTARDVACGKDIGAFTIAVATGPVPIDELAQAEPWALLEQLPEPAEFRALVGIGS